MKEKIKEILSVILPLLLFVILPLSIIIVVETTQKQNETELWNNGICTECKKGEYIFTSSSHIKNSSDIFYYTCNNCHHTVGFHKIMK